MSYLNRSLIYSMIKDYNAVSRLLLLWYPDIYILVAREQGFFFLIDTLLLMSF